MNTRARLGCDNEPARAGVAYSGHRRWRCCITCSTASFGVLLDTGVEGLFQVRDATLRISNRHRVYAVLRASKAHTSLSRPRA
ncbi:hypothetical protein [Corynebacterium stationis]|uniref:hypothetical protein n=1 Tax=Corynebacterium stationis TaxID=1705 RepID=UPI00242E9610|nr:hypothetical protein [Corynebacterium stationis]